MHAFHINVTININRTSRKKNEQEIINEDGCVSGWDETKRKSTGGTDLLVEETLAYNFHEGLAIRLYA